MNPNQLLQAAQMLGKFQKNPEAIKTYIPDVENWFSIIHRTAARHFPYANHVVIMMDRRKEMILLQIVDMEEDGQVKSLAKVWLSDFLNDISVKDVPETIKLLNDGASWEEISSSLFNQKKPVQTFEESMLDLADSVQNEYYSNKMLFDKLEPTLEQEYENGSLETLTRLLKEHFNENDLIPLKNWLKLDERWSQEFHKELVWKLWNKDPQTVKELGEIWNQQTEIDEQNRG